MSNLVIAAIPDENDRVWKVSSEKVPHLTILFLGDTDKVANLDQIMLFVEHAASTTLRRFYLPVDRRGELGADQADVLFFKKGRYDYKAIRDFRAALLQDNNIKKAYDAATQFEGPWNPHLTLGYPATPAKPVPDDMGPSFYSVDFNKIAVWTGDYEGPDFLLKDYGEEFDEMEIPMDVAMSDLQHFGVKGMRWGVRREDAGSAARSVGKAAKSAGGAVGKAAGAVSRFAGDVQFENMAEDGRARNAVISKAAAPFRTTDLPAVKARHGDYGKLINRAKKPLSKEARAYRQDARETYIKRLESTANSMKNVSGDRQYTIRERGIELPAEGGALPTTKHYWEVSSRRVKHADTDAFTRLEVLMDSEGYITGLKQVEIEDEMAQAADLGAAFLAHYGVKGMKWGVRNTQPETKTSRWDPEGHSLAGDVAKSLFLSGPLLPLSIPANVRLYRGAGRGIGAKVQDVKEKREVKRNAKDDAKFEKVAKSQEGFVAIHNGAADRVNREIGAINSKHPGDLTKSPAKQKAYDAEVTKMMQDAYRESANSLTNKRGDKHVDLEFHNDGLDFTIKVKEGPPKFAAVVEDRVKHAAVEDDDAVTFGGKIKRTPTGHILGLVFDDFEPVVEHSAMELGEAFILEHYGVKGMRWGISRNRGTPLKVAPKATSVVPHGSRRRTKVKTEGGENHPASDDAIKVAQARVKLKKSGTAALSNKELQDLQTRLNLERNVGQLVKESTTAGRGRKFVKGLTGTNKEFNEALGAGLQTSRLVKQIR